MTTIDIETATEDEAIHAFWEFTKRFGWAGSFFTREDAENQYRIHMEARAMELGTNERTESVDYTMPDDVWQRVQDSYYWRKGLPERMTEDGWDIVDEAVSDALSR